MDFSFVKRRIYFRMIVCVVKHIIFDSSILSTTVHTCLLYFTMWYEVSTLLKLQNNF